MKRIGALIILVAATGVFASAQAPRLRIEWPGAPEQARIRFVRSITPGLVRGRPSRLARFFTAIIGGRDEPRMEQPYGIAVGADRRVYVADTTGHAVHVYDLERQNYSSIEIDGDSLVGVAVAYQRLYVTDSASARVLCFDLRGRRIWTRGKDDGFVRPTGLVAGDDRLYVVDTILSRVVMLSFDGRVMGTFGGRGVETGQFNYPTNIARDRTGRLYVTDTMNFRVQIFDRDGRPRGSFGNPGDGSGDFDKPKGIAVDADGHVYVVEAMRDVVQIFDPGGELLLAFGGSGTSDGQLWLPSGIAIANGAVYVADAANRRVQMFEYLPEAR